MSSFLDLVDAVGAYYGAGSDQWRIIAQGGINSPEALEIISQVPGVNVTVSNSGKILGYDFANDFPNSTPASSVINSNTQTGAFNNSFSSNIPGSAEPPSTDLPNGSMNSGAKLSGVGTTVATVADKVSLAVAGVALGTKLGKMIDAGIYAFNPTWFDEHFPTINPETWDDMATTQGGKQFIQSLFGLQNDSATMYIDERLLAQMYMVLLANGAYSSGSTESSYDTAIQNVLSREYTPNPMPSGSVYRTQCRMSLDYIYGYTFVVGNNTAPIYTVAFAKTGTSYGTYGNTYYYIAVSEQPFSGGYQWGVLENANPQLNTPATQSTTRYSGRTFYYWYHGTSTEGNYPDYLPQVFSSYTSSGGDISRDIGTIIFDGVTTTTGGLDGVADNPNATTFINPSLITGSNLNDVLQQLKTNYPDLFNDSIYTNVPQPDGTIQQITYIPVPYPNGSNTSQPTTDTTPNVNPQTDPQVNPNTNPTSAQDIADAVTTPTNNAPDTGDGDTPVVPPVTGSASSLWKIYNPSQAQIDAFGAWLWSSDFIDQIKKLFNDPMQAIIGVHKVFCTPAIGGSATIKCGYLDSEVPSNWVSDQYTHIDCGTVSLPEYFGNVFDYDPFTRVSLFLPCVGIVPLDVAEVMRASINVKLHCDVLTGALLAEVNVIRDQAGGILYTYSGSCIVTYPVSSGTYVGAVANVVSVAASVAAGIMGTVASGGALAPAAVGAAGAAVSGLSHTRTNVQHSGSFSGAAGVMGGKIPYLIITRPQTRMADQYPAYDGVPANFTSRLGDCTGYVKVKEVHLKVPNAYESEIAEIENLLHQGVLI